MSFGTQGVNDQVLVTGKPMIPIEVPHIKFVGDSPSDTYFPQAQDMPSKFNYGPVFLRNLWVPITHPGDLLWFANQGNFKVGIKKVRWSKAKYPEIELTLPKTLELALRLGAEYVEATVDLGPSKEEKYADPKVLESKLPPLDIVGLELPKLRLLARLRKVPDYERLDQKGLVQALTGKAPATA